MEFELEYGGKIDAWLSSGLVEGSGGVAWIINRFVFTPTTFAVFMGKSTTISSL